MTETPVTYHTVGDPGDETTPRLGYTAEVGETAPEEYAPKQRQEGICWNCGKPVGTGDHLCRFADTRQGRSFSVAMAPTAEELAAAIRRCAELRPLYLRSYDDYHQWRLALDTIDALAARLPKGR